MFNSDLEFQRYFMMLENITDCGEADDEAQINEKFADQINSERESSIN